MKVIKPDNLTLLFKSFTGGDKVFLSLGACAFFTLEAGSPERLLSEQEMWPAAEAALEKDEILDFGIPKQRGEFLVYGACSSPKPVKALEVEVRVGDIAKKLAVFGDRTWKAGLAPTDPEPFTQMRISYANAFGGEGCDLNPQGKGFVPDKNGRQPLPNVENPRRLVGAPSDRPAPAGFSASPVNWPQRTKYFGTFDKNWLVESWPHLPKDTNWEYFNAAPEDQRLPGFFRGDEKLEIANMHPQKARFGSSLPAVRSRLFINQAVNGKEVFKEVPARPETVWLFPDQERGIILFRGAALVADEEYEDVLHVMAQWEALSEEPKPGEYYYRLFRESLAPEVEPAPPPEEGEGAGESTAAVPSMETPAAAAAGAAVSPALAELVKEAEALEAKAMETLKQMGLDPDEVLKKYLIPAERPEPVSLDQLQKMTAELEAETKSVMVRFGISEADVAKLLAPKETPVASSPQEIIAQLRTAGINKPEIEAQILEFDKLSKEALASLAALEAEAAARAEDAAKAAETVKPPKPELPPAGRVLTVEEVLAMYREKKSLARLDLTSLDFSGRDLSGADFTEAILEKAIFNKAQLLRTVFTGAVMNEADCSEAALDGATFKRAAAFGTKFAKASMGGAILADGDFTSSDFSGADLRGAVLDGATLEKAKLADAKGEKISAVRTNFTAADLTDAGFAGADLTDADLSMANISFANFSGAGADGLRLFGAQGKKPDFRGASLRKSRAGGDTACEEGLFGGADLTRANWEGGSLVRAQMAGAILDNADFTKADLTGAVLAHASARGTILMKANLAEANLAKINLFKGSLRKANLVRTNLRDANLYGVDFYKAKVGKTDMTGANIKNTLLTVKL